MIAKNWPPVDRIIFADEEPYAGPLWSPMIWDGKYPLSAAPGDIYINRYKDPPLYYVFYGNNNAVLASKEEIDEWVAGGLMSPIILVHPNQVPTLPLVQRWNPSQKQSL